MIPSLTPAIEQSKRSLLADYYEIKRRRGRPRKFSTPEELKMATRIRQLSKYHQARRAILKFLGDKCPCGFSDWRALQIDHVNGGGVKELRAISSITKYYERVRANPDKYQILCANCNWIKRHTNNENAGGKPAPPQLDLL